MKDQIEEQDRLDEAEDMAEDEAEVLDEADTEDEDVSDDEGEAEEGEAEGDDDAEADGSDDEPGDDAFTVEITDEDDEGNSSIRELRARNRELKQELRKYQEGEVRTAPELGPKPKIEDFDYDEEKFTDALMAWGEQKREHEARQAAEQERVQSMQDRYNKKLTAYGEEKTSLGARDFDVAEDIVRDALSPVQQSLIVANVEKPALLVYALGKNDKHLKALAAETDPAAFLYKVAKLESKMEVTGVKKKPKPETRPNGKTVAPSSGSKHLEKLREEAAKTGDMSKVHAYKRQLKASA